MGFQMALVILAGAFGGIQIDKWLSWKFPVFTVMLTIFAVGVAIYQVVYDLLKPPK
jgi:hypothetical protein